MKYLRCLLHSWAPRPGRWCGGHLLWRRAEGSRARWFSGSPARDLKPQLPSPGCSPGPRWWCLLPEEGGEEKEKSLFCSETHKQRASLEDTLQQSASFFMQVSWKHACDAGEEKKKGRKNKKLLSDTQEHHRTRGGTWSETIWLYTVHDRQPVALSTFTSWQQGQGESTDHQHTWFFSLKRDVCKDTGKKSPNVNLDCERCCGTSDMTLFHNSYSPRCKQSQEGSFPKCTEIMRCLFYCHLFHSNYKNSSV